MPADGAPAPDLDLTSCDREEIHLLGAIQPCGFLIAAWPDWNVARVSANIAAFAGRPMNSLLGKPLRSLLSPGTLHVIRNKLATLTQDLRVERAFAVDFFGNGALFDIAVHQSGSQIILEAQPSGPDRQMAATPPSAMIARLQRADGVAALYRETARLIRGLTGFDRVMVYCFQPDGSGEVVAESLRSGVEGFLGLRYPASDIPVQARALYVRNPIRTVANVQAPPVPVVPQLCPDGQRLDLSDSVLRSLSPVHLEYLRNMGAAASMSVSLLTGGKLWGLIVCHHMTPLVVSLEQQAMIELLSQVIAMLLDAHTRDASAQYQSRARQVHDQIMAAMATQSITTVDTAKLVDLMMELMPCSGVGLWLSQSVTLKGATPDESAFTGLVEFLNQTSPSRVFSTDELSKVYEPAQQWKDCAAGVLTIPISRTPRDYVVFFRQEIARSVDWAGNPHKPASPGPDAQHISPRDSFAAWREVVRGKSAPWSAGELHVAESLRMTLIEVVLRMTDMAEQQGRQAADKHLLLIGELNHRVRNILGLIQGLVTRSVSASVSAKDFATVLGGRVRALALAHDQITSRNWGPSALRALIQTETLAFLDARAAGSRISDNQAQRLRLSGPDVMLDPDGYATLALVVHELITNAAKYGALSNEHGTIDVSWSRDPEGRLVLVWIEVGGPPPQAVQKPGFGTTLITRSIQHDLNGEAQIEYRPGGIVVRLIVPAAYVSEGGATTTPMPASRPLPPARLNGRVLLVEDSVLIALAAEDMLIRLGAAHVDIVPTVNDALTLIKAETPAFAVLDVNLKHETSFAVALDLRARHIPFFFATGYGDNVVLPAALQGTPVLTKPYTDETMAVTVARVLAAAEAGNPTLSALDPIKGDGFETR